MTEAALDHAEVILKFGVYGLLFGVVAIVLPSLFLLIYRLNTANRQAEKEQRESFREAMQRAAQAFLEDQAQGRLHCREEMERICQAFEDKTQADARHLDAILEFVVGRRFESEAK